MRICFISREYPPDTGWGGIGAYTYQLCRELARQGHEIHVVCLTKKQVTGTNPPMVKDDQVHVHRVVWADSLRLAALLNVTQPNTHHVLRAALPMWKKFLELHSEKPFDAVEAPDHLAEGIFLALTRVAPLVIRLHTPYSKFVAEGYHNIKNDFDSFIVSSLERLAMSEADLLSSPSINLAEYVARDTGVDIAQIKIVRNPVDTEKFSPEGKTAALANPFNAQSGSKLVYFAGRLEERKGIKYLIQAVPQVLKAVPEARFIIVGADTNTGAGNTSVLKTLKEFLAKSSCLDKVHFVSHIPLAEMPEYYRLADVCTVPSMFDNAPYTVLEALASGKPVIGSTAGGTPEYIEENVTGLHVPKGDSAALADAIITMLSDDDKRQKAGQAARQAALSKYACDVIAQEALRTYAIAQERHAKRKFDAIYKKAPDLLARDVVEFVKGYHGHMHAFGESLSMRYRTGLGLKLLFTRPKLSAVKVALASGKVMSRISNQPAGLTNLVSRLEKTVEIKSQEDWD
ncbi:MAG: glycosyltransferase family 4 protein [Candidatus Obscuribacterales bacterium]|jgi:glycosyltransferase involved in cell wall biosynthesis